MACPVCEPRASGPVMADYTPWHLVTLVKWLGNFMFAPRRNDRSDRACTGRNPRGKHVSSAFRPPCCHHTLSHPVCVILFSSHAFPFTIPYLMHIDLTTCNL